MVRDYTPMIDLHKCSHYDAEEEVIRFVEQYWNTGRYVEIITGNSSKMKEVVIKVLEEYTISYSIGRTFDFTNKGYITCSL